MTFKGFRRSIHRLPQTQLIAETFTQLGPAKSIQDYLKQKEALMRELNCVMRHSQSGRTDYHLCRTIEKERCGRCFDNPSYI